MKIKVLEQEFAICKLDSPDQADLTRPYCFLSRTEEEISLVCDIEAVPEKTIVCDRGWKAFRIEGTLDFSLVGILAKISLILAENDISIFAVSTFNTDYVLTKKENFERAVSALAERGYQPV